MKAKASMISRVETITPQVAAFYLSHNSPNNRRIKRAHVEMLARDMAAGEFKTTHQGIAFDTDGTLIDGQHRLHAIMMSGTTVRMMVTRNCDADATLSVDRGAARTVHDAMTIMMTDDSIRSVILRNTGMLSAMSSVVRANISSRYRLSSNDAILLYDAEPDIWNALHSILNRGGRKRGPEMAAYYAALVNGVPADVVRAFDRVMNAANMSGCDQYNVQIVLKWRRYLDDLSLKHIKLESQPVYQTTQSAIWHFYKNTRIKNINVVSTDCFPVRDHVASIINTTSFEE